MCIVQLNDFTPKKIHPQGVPIPRVKGSRAKMPVAAGTCSTDIYVSLAACNVPFLVPEWPQ